jgi:hypothetical protein
VAEARETRERARRRVILVITVPEARIRPAQALEVMAGTQHRDNVARASGETYIMDLRKHSSSTNRSCPLSIESATLSARGCAGAVIDSSF